jgi:putative FmdB family regulatory protein
MPIYEYKCQNCLTRFEIRGTFETFLFLKPVCPECGANEVKKLLSTPSIQYKGKGFYTNDHKDE